MELNIGSKLLSEENQCTPEIKNNLEWAAKAAGYELSFPMNVPHIIQRTNTGSLSKITPWNPYDDDGDSYRLAIDCSMIVQVNTLEGRTSVVTSLAGAEEQHSESNRYEATRKAIMDVAVEFAKRKFKEN